MLSTQRMPRISFLGACDVFEQFAESLNTDARAWRGQPHLPESEHVGGPLGKDVVGHNSTVSRRAVCVVIALRGAEPNAVACWHIGTAGQSAVTDFFVRELEGEPESPFLALSMGFTPPSWQDLSTVNQNEFKPGGVRQGWQHEAASRVEQKLRDQVSSNVCRPEH